MRVYLRPRRNCRTSLVCSIVDGEENKIPQKFTTYFAINAVRRICVPRILLFKKPYYCTFWTRLSLVPRLYRQVCARKFFFRDSMKQPLSLKTIITGFFLQDTASNGTSEKKAIRRNDALKSVD